MSERSMSVSLGFTDESFPESHHICLIYDNEKQRQEIVAEYIAAGFRQGELVRYFSDTTTAATVRSWLLGMGVELPESDETGPLRISDAEKAYCPDGRFDPRRMIESMPARYDAAKKAGFRGTRSCGEMSWALKGISGSDRLLEYEALINTIDSPFPHSGMCQYDSRLFDGATLFKMLQVHPYMIAQGQLVRNPFYIKPQEFLAELKE
jgi:hypothetical protein